MNVLLTGASGRIGKKLAEVFLQAGHAVAAHYHRGEDRVRVLREGANPRIEWVQADLSDRVQAQAMVQKVVRKWGCLDGLINNAGIARDRNLLQMSEAQWREVLDVNLSGAFWCLQAAARFMAREKKGFVINIGSLLGQKGAVGCANYVAAKAGLVGLTKAAALELGRFQIRVNAVFPGFHLTDLSENLSPDRRREVLSQHVLGRSTDLQDMARFVLTLAETSTVSGQIFNIDSRLG